MKKGFQKSKLISKTNDMRILKFVRKKEEN